MRIFISIIYIYCCLTILAGCGETITAPQPTQEEITIAQIQEYLHAGKWTCQTGWTDYQNWGIDLIEFEFDGIDRFQCTYRNKISSDATSGQEYWIESGFYLVYPDYTVRWVTESISDPLRSYRIGLDNSAKVEFRKLRMGKPQIMLMLWDSQFLLFELGL